MDWAGWFERPARTQTRPERPAAQTALEAAFLCCLAYTDLSPDQFELRTSTGVDWSSVRFRFSHWTRVSNAETDAQAVCCFEKTSRTCWIAFRGTESARDALCDMYAVKQRWPGRASDGPPCHVHAGFLAQYESVSGEIYAFVARHALSHQSHQSHQSHTHVGKPHGVSIAVTGHSLGGALAVLCAADLMDNEDCIPGLRSIECTAFGCPRVGDERFVAEVARMESSPEAALLPGAVRFGLRRLILGGDPVTRVPSRATFRHAGRAWPLRNPNPPTRLFPDGAFGNVLQKASAALSAARDAAWDLAVSGLRKVSRPFPRGNGRADADPWWEVARVPFLCELGDHDMRAYLDAVAVHAAALSGA